MSKPAVEKRLIKPTSSIRPRNTTPVAGEALDGHLILVLDAVCANRRDSVRIEAFGLCWSRAHCTLKKIRRDV